jgi:membrane protease YdiL (CAAX protease family)
MDGHSPPLAPRAPYTLQHEQQSLTIEQMPADPNDSHPPTSDPLATPIPVSPETPSHELLQRAHEGLQPPRHLDSYVGSGVAPMALAQPDEYPPWSGWDVIAVFGVFIVAAAFIGPVIILSILRAKYGSHLNFEAIENDGRFAAAVYVIGSIPSLALLWHFASRGSERASRALRLPLPPSHRWRYVVAGIGVGIVAAVAEVLLPIPKDVPITKLFTTAVSAWSVSLLGVFVAPFVEELLFRGFMYPVVARAAGRNAGIAITGFAFAMLHAGQLGFSWAALLVMFGVGVAFTVVRVVADSVAASMLTHFVYNAVQVTIGLIASNGFRNLGH